VAETAVVALLFCDLVASTELLRALGDDASDVVRRSLFDALGSAVREHRGTVVKTAGDGMMVTFATSAADAVACAVDMQRAAGRIQHDDEPLGLQLRIGISFGEASREVGDWFGTPVVEAARLESAARPGQILVSEVVQTIVGTRGGARFRPAGKRDFKGFPRPVVVIEVLWDDGAAPGQAEVKPRQARIRSTRPRRVFLVASTGAFIAGGAVLAVVFLVARGGGGDGSGTAVANALPLVADGYTPSLEEHECRGGSPLDNERHCEDLVVPESRSNPEGRQVRIQVTTYPARTTSPGAPTIAIGSFWDNYEESAVRTYGDYVQFDIRGGTLAEPSLTCPEMTAVQRQLLATRAGPETDAVYQPALEECGKRLTGEGIDLDQYGLNDMVTDLRDLAIAKGWREFNLQVNSDWARIGVLFAQRYPQVVRAIVIADPLPFGSQWNSYITNMNTSIRAYAAACEADLACARAFPDIPGLIERKYAEFRDHPVTIETADPEGGAPWSVYIDGNRTIHAVIMALGLHDALPLIASTLASPDEQGSLRTTASFLVDQAFRDPASPWGMWTSTYCEDVAQLNARPEIEARSTSYPMLREEGRVADDCAHWPTHANSALATEVRVSPVPALILGGGLTPWSPPAFAHDIARAFSNATVVTLPNEAAAPLQLGPPCVSDLRLAFLRDPHAELDVAGCIAQAPAIAFQGT
jgi:class 3 adenylate cyclase/pimeloyl-ACP methyl ester carboxylesterase